MKSNSINCYSVLTSRPVVKGNHLTVIGSNSDEVLEKLYTIFIKNHLKAKVIYVVETLRLREVSVVRFNYKDRTRTVIQQSCETFVNFINQDVEENGFLLTETLVIVRKLHRYSFHPSLFDYRNEHKSKRTVDNKAVASNVTPCMVLSGVNNEQLIASLIAHRLAPPVVILENTVKTPLTHSTPTILADETYFIFKITAGLAVKRMDCNFQFESVGVLYNNRDDEPNQPTTRYPRKD